MNGKKKMLVTACVSAAATVAVVSGLLYMSRNRKEGGPLPAEEESREGVTGTTAQSAAGMTTGAPAEIAQQDRSGSGSTAAAARSPEMDALDQKLRKELGKKSGKWSLYMYRFDTGEEIGIDANDAMISASLIKLYVAGCYFEQVEKGKVRDDYQKLMFKMISESDNSATNRLIDILGMKQINSFMKKHGFKAGQLNRKMLEKNKKENYTSTRDCGMVLREVYLGTFVSPDGSKRLMDALRAQIERNRKKIPAGVPKGIETANKTGELFTKDEKGVNVAIQNDAAIIFAPNHPYVLTVMTSVPSGGEEQLHREIAAISKEVYEAICLPKKGKGTQKSAEKRTEKSAGKKKEAVNAAAGMTGAEAGSTTATAEEAGAGAANE